MGPSPHRARADGEEKQELVCLSGASGSKQGCGISGCGVYSQMTVWREWVTFSSLGVYWSLIESLLVYILQDLVLSGLSVFPGQGP